MEQFQIIPGSTFGTYKTVAVSIGKASKQNRDGIVANFIVRTLRPYDKINRITKAGDPVNDIIWEEDDPELYNILSNYKNAQPIPQGQPNAGSFTVPMQILQQVVSKGDRLLSKVIAFEEQGGEPLTDEEEKDFYERSVLKPLLIVEGGKMLPYKFAKGACYANDANGKRTTDGAGNPVIRSEIEIFCVIDHAIENPDGSLSYSYANGMSPSTKGARLEQRFWHTPVNAGAAQTVNLPPVQSQPATQPAAQQQNAPTAQPAMQAQAPGEATPF